MLLQLKIWKRSLTRKPAVSLLESLFLSVAVSCFLASISFTYDSQESVDLIEAFY